MRNKKDLCSQKLIKEGFFNKTDDLIGNLCNAFKSLIFNYKDYENEYYKFYFLENNFKQDLLALRNKLCKTPKKYIVEEFYLGICKMYEDVDGDIVSIFKLKKLSKDLREVLENYDSIDHRIYIITQTFDNYINSLDDKIKKANKVFINKTEEDQYYSTVNDVKLNDSILTDKDFEKQKYLLQIELLKLQEWVKENKKKVLIILEGRDGAGKGGAISVFSEYMNPNGCRIETFGIPTEEESLNWFERYKKVLPNEGEIVFFDRSWYNRAVVEPVMGFCSTEQYHDFMESVNNFEQEQINNGVHIIKMWFSISKEKQKIKFELRKTNPLKYWKYSKNDENSINMWDEFTFYINKMFKKTNTKICPWNVMDSNDWKFYKIKAIKHILSQFDYDNRTMINQDIIESASKDKNKYIFLDIDGVLITKLMDDKLNHREFNIPKYWNKKAIDNLNKIVDATGAKIIVSSSYRKTKTVQQINDRLKEVGLKHSISGKITPIPNEKRGMEIKAWLQQHPYDAFVILDDNFHDILSIYPTHLVKVNTHEGLSKEDATKAIGVLNKHEKEHYSKEQIKSIIKECLNKFIEDYGNNK